MSKLMITSMAKNCPKYNKYYIKLQAFLLGCHSTDVVEKIEKWERIGEAHSLVTTKLFNFYVTIVLYISATVVGRVEVKRE